jgi:hypothetical protein
MGRYRAWRRGGTKGVDLGLWVIVADLPFRSSQHHVADLHAERTGIHGVFELRPEAVGDSGLDTCVDSGSTPATRRLRTR